MSALRALALAFLIAAPASAQQFSTGGAIYSGGPSETRFGLSSRVGTNGRGAYMEPPVSLAAVYDLGNSQVIWGGVDFNGSTQYAAKTTGALPAISGGIPAYPFTVVILCKTDAVGSGAYLASWGTAVDASDDDLSMGIDSSGRAFSYVEDGGSGTSTTTSVAFTANRWHYAIFTFASDSARAVYSDVDATGATSSTTLPVGSLGQFQVARRGTGSYWNGEIGPIWILSGDLSGAGNANLRGAIFAGADPVRASRGVATLIAHYPMQAATGASQSGLYDLTPANIPTATNRLLVARDLSGNGRHVRATTAPPTYSASQGNGQGGGAFASASSQFLVFDGSVPDVAPFQVYAVARTTTTAARGNVWWLGDKDSSNDSWSVEFDGTNALSTGDDRIVFNPFDTSISPISGTTYSADTDYVIWALESSSTSRAVQVNGTNQATGSTDLSPDGADRFALGRYSAATPSVHLDGQIHYVILQTTASTSGKTRIERFLGAAFNVSVP